MGLLGKLVRGAIQTVSLPVDVVKDTVTGLGMATDKDEPYTIEKLKDLAKTAEDIDEDIRNLGNDK